MDATVQKFIEFCQWDTSSFLIFSDNVFGKLIYYSHFLAFFLALVVGFFVLLRDKKALVNRVLFYIMLAFSAWVFLDLILWANEKPYLIMFSWSAMLLAETLVYALCVYFIDVFIEKKDVSFKKKIGIFSLLLPVIIFMPTKLSLVDFDLTNCFREPHEGIIATYYVYLIEIIYVIWILVYAVKKYRQSPYNTRRQVTLVTLGLILFLLSFVSGNIIGSLTENWTLAQVGLFSLPVFVFFLGYLIVEFKTFNIKIIGTQALVFALSFLVLAILFIKSLEDVRLVVIFTFVFVILLGILLVRSVKREIRQKEELVKLNTNLENLLRQREALTHLITHKIKGSFTRSKYVFAGILDGMFGPINADMKKYVEQGLESDDNGVKTIDLILNAANLQKGTVKYDMKPVDLGETVKKTLEEKKEIMEKKGLTLDEKIGEGEMKVNGDIFWLSEVVNNFIDNAIHYTPEGAIVVGLEKKGQKILFYVKDSGIGITSEDKKHLFTEGGRGKDSVKVNVDSTGYGLYTVKLVVEAHGGKTWVDSEGPGKGSTFFAEFDAI